MIFIFVNCFRLDVVEFFFAKAPRPAESLARRQGCLTMVVGDATTLKLTPIKGNKQMPDFTGCKTNEQKTHGTATKVTAPCAKFGFYVKTAF